MEPTQIALIAILIISVIAHELAHGYAANWLGDPTARLAGRLSVNPIVHLDPMMSVLLPGILLLTGSPIIFGAAKPVPYNPYNFTRYPRFGEALVAAAGPAANIFIAVIFALLIRSADMLSLSVAFVNLAAMVVILNIFLAFFNLVPIPPLDGSKILPRFLPPGLAQSYDDFRNSLERQPAMGFLLVIGLFILVLAEPLHRLTIKLTQLLAGV